MMRSPTVRVVELFLTDSHHVQVHLESGALFGICIESMTGQDRLSGLLP